MLPNGAFPRACRWGAGDAAASWAPWGCGASGRALRTLRQAARRLWPCRMMGWLAGSVRPPEGQAGPRSSPACCLLRRCCLASVALTLVRGAQVMARG